MLDIEQFVEHRTNQGSLNSSAIINSPSSNEINGQFKYSGEAISSWNGKTSQWCRFSASVIGIYEIQLDKPDTEFSFSASWGGFVPLNTFNDPYTINHIVKINLLDSSGIRTLVEEKTINGTINHTGVTTHAINDHIKLIIQIDGNANTDGIFESQTPFIRDFQLDWSFKTTATPIVPDSPDACIATYKTDGTLSLPCVTVPNDFNGSDMYQADMTLIPFTNPLSFKLTGAQQKEESFVGTENCTASFIADGSLNIPCVSVPDGSGSSIMYQADLQLVPSSNTLMFKLINAQLKE